MKWTNRSPQDVSDCCFGKSSDHHGLLLCFREEAWGATMITDDGDDDLASTYFFFLITRNDLLTKLRMKEAQRRSSGGIRSWNDST